MTISTPWWVSSSPPSMTAPMARPATPNDARLVLAEPGELDLDRLADTVAREKVDTLWLTARLFSQVVESHPHLLAGVHRVLAGSLAIS